MNHIDALIYSLGEIHYGSRGQKIGSRSVYDCDGNGHWVEFDKDGTPMLCGGTIGPFSEQHEPYTIKRETQKVKR